MCKTAVNASICLLVEPRKTSTLPAICAQTVDQNIGQPLQKMLSYICSTTLLFKGFRVWFENFKFQRVKHG
jgi:hypothetical protein